MTEGKPVGFAISLRSDHPSAEAVRELWRSVARFEDQPSMSSLGYPPHITLAIYDGDAVDAAQVREALRRGGQNLGALTVTLDAIRTFDGPSLILWAAPRPNQMLQSVHAATHAVIDPGHCRSYYRPGAWVPHCTLGTRIRADRREAALSFAAEFAGGIELVFDALDCISFPPLAPFEMQKLP